MKPICALFLILLAPLAIAAAEPFDDLQILERDEARIKATGDLRGEPKLMKVVVQFRDNDLLISGNDYRYGYITVVPYAAIQTLMYSDIGDDLPQDMRETAPLFQDAYAGQDQRWLNLQYSDTSLFLMLSNDPNTFLRALQNHTGKSIDLFVETLPRQIDDTALRQCRIVQTIPDSKGRPKTDDYACLILLTSTHLILKGKDKNFQQQIDIPYSQIQNLSYEHARESTYMGRMPGFGAFRKPKHWFVILHDKNVHTPFLLEAEDVAEFRQAFEKKSNLTINTQVPSMTRTQPLPTTLPERFDTQPPETTTQLTRARTIRCTLGPGQRANWESQNLNRDPGARFDDKVPDILFANIDHAAQTAQMQFKEQTHTARVGASSNGLTFITVADNQTLITSIFSQNERLICIHSHHTGGQTPRAGQFYGVAEIVE